MGIHTHTHTAPHSRAPHPLLYHSPHSRHTPPLAPPSKMTFTRIHNTHQRGRMSAQSCKTPASLGLNSKSSGSSQTRPGRTTRLSQKRPGHTTRLSLTGPVWRATQRTTNTSVGTMRWLLLLGLVTLAVVKPMAI